MEAAVGLCVCVRVPVCACACRGEGRGGWGTRTMKTCTKPLCHLWMVNLETPWIIHTSNRRVKKQIIHNHSHWILNCSLFKRQLWHMAQWLHVAHLVLSGAFVDFRDTAAKIQGPFLPGWCFRVEIHITRRSWAINIPNSFGKESTKTFRPLQLLKGAVCVCDLHCCKLLCKVGCGYVEGGFTQGLRLAVLEDFHKQSCSILQTRLPKVVLVDIFDTFKVKLSAKVPCESHLVDHFFGVHTVFTGTEQLKVTCRMDKKDGLRLLQTKKKKGEIWYQK